MYCFLLYVYDAGSADPAFCTENRGYEEIRDPESGNFFILYQCSASGTPELSGDFPVYTDAFCNAYSFVGMGIDLCHTSVERIQKRAETGDPYGHDRIYDSRSQRDRGALHSGGRSLEARHGGADAENLITEAVAGAEQEHRLVFELIGTHIGAVHPRVMRGYGHDHVLFIDLLGHEACVGERVGGDGHINLPRAKLVEQLRSEVLFKEERHFGCGNGHRTDELRQKIGRNRINHAEAQRSRERILTAVGNVDDAAAFFEYLLGLSDDLRADADHTGRLFPCMRQQDALWLRFRLSSGRVLQGKQWLFQYYHKELPGFPYSGGLS